MSNNNTPSAKVNEAISSKYIQLDDLKLHYLEMGKGEVVLMIHGFPTSSYLWRNIMPKVAETHRAIALDLPAYGKSDKPLDASYSFNYFNRTLNNFLTKLEIKSLHLVVHDFGGPIGILWAVRHPEAIKSLTFLNTLVYPNFSWAVKLFGLLLRLPVTKNWLTSPAGIRLAMRLGVQHKNRIAGELLQNYQAPFLKTEDRQVLRKSVTRLSIKAFLEIEKKLPLFTVPARVIYGINDRALPKVADTMKRIKKDLPQTEITAIPDCGHFLQEDEPEFISKLISEFLNRKKLVQQQ